MNDTSAPKLNFTREDVIKSLTAVDILIDKTAYVLNLHNNEPEPNSIALQERNTFRNPKLIKDAHCRGVLSIESAVDHLMLLSESFKEPVKTIAPWTCLRGMLESCAIAAWFLDPVINARTRVERYFAFRYVGLNQQLKYFQIEKKDVEISKAKKLISKVEQDAILLGYPRVLDKDEKIKGIALKMPTITEVIKLTLDKELQYRLLSGVAHGQHWAINALGFRSLEVKDESGITLNRSEKHLSPGLVLYALNVGITSFAQVTWYLWRLYGWDEKEITDILDSAYSQLNYKDELRFWHSAL